jgi:hypothetical protein
MAMCTGMATAFSLFGNHAPTPPATGEAELAQRLFGKASIFPLRRDGQVTAVRGWIVGRGRAECRDGENTLTWVHLDVLVTDDGRYMICERVGTQQGSTMSIPVTSVLTLDLPDAVRTYCESMVDDPLRAAVRCAALDDAVRRWPPLRQSPKKR